MACYSFLNYFDVCLTSVSSIPRMVKTPAQEPTGKVYIFPKSTFYLDPAKLLNPATGSISTYISSQLNNNFFIDTVWPKHPLDFYNH